jgi:2-oxoglutarate/2-oxoacid ferredoxin oxidoreductase subunit beta
MSIVSDLAAKQAEFLAFEHGVKHTWCSGCGNYGIYNALVRALVLQNYDPDSVMIAFDVGCNSNASDKIHANTIHGLHGRVLPLAAGLHLANPKLPVIAVAGDGATLSEGLNHYLHAVRNNYNITFLLHNNKNYGLTTGQASSTTPQGNAMNGVVGVTAAETLEPLELALAAGATFLARGYTADVDQLTRLIQAGMQHPGFAVIEILQLCPTYNKATPEQWYDERVVRQDDVCSDRVRAFSLVQTTQAQIATGILYQDTSSVDFYTAQQSHRVGIATQLTEEVHYHSVSDLMAQLQ